MTDAGGAAARPRARRLLVLPLVLLALVLLLTALDLNGSSVGALAPEDDASSLVAGRPRAVRSDEYRISTPQQVANARRGNPATAEVGLTATDLGATSLGTAVSSWTEPFRPFSWPYLLPDVSRAFALRWWCGLAAGVLGVWLLLLALQVREGLAVVTALAVGLAPVVAWWQAAMPGPVVGLLCAAGAAVLVGVRAASPWRATAWALLGAWLAVAAFLVLYPPWFLSVGLVVAALVVGELVRRRTPPRRWLLVVGVLVVATGAVVALWAWESRDALAALAGTTYPGERRASGGEGSLAFLLSAPLNLLLSQGPVLARGDGVNLSEVSAPWLVLPAVTAAAVVGVAVLRRGDRATWRRGAPVLAVSVALGVLLVWTLVPLPSAVGRLLLLDRVPGTRTALALGLAVALLAALLAGHLPRSRATTAALWVGALATGALAGWSAWVLVRPQLQTVGVLTGVVVGCTAGALWLLVLRRPDHRPALAALGLLGLASYIVVNPLYRGLGPLTSGPVLDAVRTAGPGRWVVTDGASRFGPTVSSEPGVTLSGLTYYPDETVWERLAPGQRDVWDNFMTFRWHYEAGATPVRLERVALAEADAYVDLCSPDVAFLAVDHVLSRADEPRPPCFVVSGQVEAGGDRLVVLSRVA